MKPCLPYAQINMAKVPADGNVGGLIFAIGTAMIFFWGIPLVRYMLPAAICLGCGVAFLLHFVGNSYERKHRLRSFLRLTD